MLNGRFVLFSLRLGNSPSVFHRLSPMSHSNLEANYCYAKNDSFNFIKLIMEIKKKKIVDVIVFIPVFA